MALSQLLFTIVLLMIGAALSGLSVWLTCQNRAQSQAEQLYQSVQPVSNLRLQIRAPIF